jgi:hypothetical protein
MRIKFKEVKPVFGMFLFIIYLLISSNADARLVITSGSSEKKQQLLQMLQTSTFPGSPPAGVVNLDTNTGNITISGTSPTNHFGRTLKKIIDDTSRIELMLDKVINGIPVFLGAFNGGTMTNDPANGKQSIDVNDLRKLDSTGYFGLGSWRVYLLHELVEQFVGWKYGLRFLQAHDSALVAEFEMIYAIGGIRFVRDAEVRRGDTLYFIYRDLGTGRRFGIGFPLNQFGQIDTVNKGAINDLKTSHVSGGCASGLCGFSEGENGIIYEPIPGTGGLAGAEYLIKDEKGNIYASLPQQEKVVRFSYTGVVDIQYQHSSLSYPAGLAFDPSTQELFVGCSKQNHIVVFDRNGTYKRTLSPSGLVITAGLDIDPEGNIYISSHGNNCILYITPAGEVIRYISNSLLQGPAGLVYLDGLERLLAVSNTNNKILSFSKNGSYLGVFGGEANLGSPWGISISGGKFDKTFPIGPRYLPLERVAVTNANSNGMVIFNPDGSIKHNLSQSGFQPKAMLITHSFGFTPIAVTEISSETPTGFSLGQNYPNPFNPKTNIEFALFKPAFVKLAIYDMLGREVETIVNNQLTAGTYKVDWNAAKYSSGVYFYKLITDDFTDTKKMMLVK